ncbi:MAG TPA: hypothetical protein VMK12_30325 [Anaeromyxobacteraceae bacterium]|nr:hypothetical protein [Anaeromyxobacteraceae bacterium]
MNEILATVVHSAALQREDRVIIYAQVVGIGMDTSVEIQQGCRSCATTTCSRDVGTLRSVQR